METVLEAGETEFNLVRVIERQGRIDFDVDGATFASFHPDKLCTGYSWDAVTAGCLVSTLAPARVLVLGLAGGTCTRQLRHLLPDAHITAVEIDGALVKLAQKYMELDAQNIEVVVGDAYAFLNSSTSHWDAIIDDLFLTGETDVVRSKVTEGEVLESMRARLSPEGVIAANVITDVGHNHIAAATRTAFAHAFADTLSIVPPRGLNEVVVGGRSLRPFPEVRALATRFLDESDRRLWRAMRVVRRGQ